ncbi:alpha/beta hydrolase [Actinoplanes xinjiangensis]|uniref:S-formylglutathione hydrolase FrmB n=1 Tax=Actinoplanes xinjiangensis TaxID=512350 RepID=A0A316FL31_9ACTN|nr:alpha/beta fold hydrolase [Actinoplanes xinjiangensis]PWK48963.1 S-formylglutathione hydrolase FrmB [Actinoplanes xinjiangensis]GIF38669.1 esterase [Actinoplanes xinjiangensis]
MSGIVLTSGWVVGSLIAVTIGAAVATAAFWDRGRFRIVHRAAGLIIVQLLLLVSIAAVVNRQANFYVTLGELFGQGGDTYAQTLPVDAPRLSADGGGREDLDRWLAGHPTAPGRGTVVPATLAGARTGYALPAQIYLPAGYTAPAGPRGDLPVVMFLAGYPGTVYSWLDSVGVGAALDDAIGAGRLPPLIAVLAEQDPVRGRDSECVDSALGVRADTYLTTDIPEIVHRHFRAAAGRQNWAVVGYSTGGFCAVNLALRHPDQFAAAASLAGYFRPLIDRSTGDLYQGDLDLRRANDPRLMIGRQQRAPLHLFLTAGAADRAAQRDLKAFAPMVRAPDTAVVIADRPGGHNFTTWRSILPDLFTWLDRHLRAGRDTAA